MFSLFNYTGGVKDLAVEKGVAGAWEAVFVLVWDFGVRTDRWDRQDAASGTLHSATDRDAWATVSEISATPQASSGKCVISR